MLIQLFKSVKPQKKLNLWYTRMNICEGYTDKRERWGGRDKEREKREETKNV